MNTDYLSAHDIEYLHLFAKLHDERKALTQIFGKYTPLKRHDEIMRKPLARKKFKSIVDNAVKDMELSSSSALQRLMNIQSANLGDFIDLATGVIKKDIDPKYLDAIKSISYDTKEGTVKEITLYDKLRAIETTLKFAGVLSKKIDIEVSVSIADQLSNKAIGEGDVDDFIKGLLAKPKEDAIDVEVSENE